MADKIYPRQKEILDFIESQPKNTKLAIMDTGRSRKIVAVSKKDVFIYKNAGKWEAAK